MWLVYFVVVGVSLFWMFFEIELMIDWKLICLLWWMLILMVGL